MLVFAILAVFIAGLMVGRTPEYLGKKIEAKEVKMAMLAVLVSRRSRFSASRRSRASRRRPRRPAQQRRPARLQRDPLRLQLDGTGNNGSAFAGLSANTLFYNLTIGLAMLFGRFLMIVPMLAIAGSLVKKKLVPASSRNVPDDTARCSSPCSSA